MEITILFIILIGIWAGRSMERMKVRWTLMKGQMSQQMAQNRCNQFNGCHSCCNCRNNGPRNNGNNRNNRNRNRNRNRQNNGGNRQSGGNPRYGAWMN